MHSNVMYHKAELVLRECSHSGECEIDMGYGETLYVCVECWNEHVYLRREARKQELREHNATLPQCERCGKHPANWTYGPYRLCGRCKTTTEREHWSNAAKTGNALVAGMISGRPICDTSKWAGRKA